MRTILSIGLVMELRLVEQSLRYILEQNCLNLKIKQGLGWLNLYWEIFFGGSGCLG